MKQLNIRATVRSDVWQNLRYLEDLDKWPNKVKIMQKRYVGVDERAKVPQKALVRAMVRDRAEHSGPCQEPL